MLCVASLDTSHTVPNIQSGAKMCQEDHPQHAGPTSVVRPKDARLPGEAERHQCFARSADGMMVRPGIQWLTKLNVG